MIELLIKTCIRYWCMLKKSGICLLCLQVIVLFPATAQQDTSKKLKQVNITATQQTKPQAVVPVQQLDAREFKQFSAFTVADAVRNFAGVNVRDYGGIGGLKTISVRSLGAEHTAVLYDGIQLNDAQNGQIDLGRFNLQNLQQITLYNSQPPQLCQPARAYASASVLVITPLHPHLTNDKPYQITTGIKAGSFGLINPYLQWQQRLGKQWSFNINTNLQKATGRYKYKDEDTDTTATRTNSDIKLIQTDAALYWVKSDSNKLILRFNHYAANQGLPGAVITNAGVSTQRLRSNDYFTQATYDRQWNNSLHLLINTKYSRSYLHYIDTPFYNTQHKLEQFYIQHEVYQSAALSYQPIRNLTVSYAGDISYATLDDTAYNYSYPKRITVLNVLAAKYTLAKWLFQASVLNTYVNDNVKFGAASPARDIYSPAFEAAWKPFTTADLQVRGFYKYIFRYPTFNDLYYSDLGQRNVKPEFTQQYNLGLAYAKSFDGAIEYLSATADGYYNKVKDKIIAIPSKNVFMWSITNYGKVDIRGLDAGVKLQTAAFNQFRFTLAANYTYQQALNITDPNSSTYNNQIPYTPRNTLALNAGVIYNKFSLFYNQISTSHRYYLNENVAANYLAGYSVSDLSINYNSKIYHFPTALLLEVNNLFNKQYDVIDRFPMPGTSVRITFQLTI